MNCTQFAARDSFLLMRFSTHHLDFEQSAPPDSGGARCSFLFVGGAAEVEAAAKRRGELEYKALVAITVVSVLFAVYWLCCAGDWEFAFATGLSGLLAPFIGSSIYWLATSSLAAQEKSGKRYEAVTVAREFAVRLLVASLRLSVRRISDFLPLAYALALKALQRRLAATANLAHIALSRKLLVIPVCLR